ncbi:MAG TPA: cyclopropane-fatty-acyl-phospholipid synthase family protein [Gaiellaceae bacterium]|nr:cyclopropane-fatty-acyl-phospholipid synthase family protein [Gaiellaceae bacterium]
MNAVPERSPLRLPPAPRGGLLESVAVTLLERILPSLRHGTLVADLPDGSTRRFGEGPEVGVDIRSRRFFHRLATRGKLALGESYTAGEWDADDLVAFFELLLRNAEAAADRHPRLNRVVNARPRLNRRNGLLRARRNIGYHYDLGNELFELFLDETMTYSCAVFERPDEPVEDAQRRKLRLVCEKLRLGPGDHVLEIGCGWGSFALTAAGEYGARVTGLTISSEQAALARERVAAAGLGDRVEILEEDYRTHEGSYTKIASIEMIEAIGEREFPRFFAACDRLLAPGGLACVQSILVPESRYERYRRSPDWIERYVFPGCLIPSLAALTSAMAESSRLTLYGVEEIGPGYAETLRRWRERFLGSLDRVRALGYDERFVRTWDFYLAFCEAAFRTRALRDAQLVLTRPMNEALS